MRKAIILFGVVLLASCSTPPKTVTEFRAAMLGGAAFSKQETHNINREFSVVVSDVKRKSTECLNFGYTRTTRYGVNMSQTTDIYHPRVRVVGNSKAEMTMQIERLPKSTSAPEGGYYVFLADIQKTGADKTRMAMYGSSFPTWQAIFDAIKGWAEGKNVKCPDSP